MENLKRVFLPTVAHSKVSKGWRGNLIESTLHSRRHKTELLNKWGEKEREVNRLGSVQGSNGCEC